MKSKILIGIIVVILACCAIYAGTATFSGSDDNKLLLKTENLEQADNLIVNDEQKVEKKLYTTDKADTNTILVENNSTLDIKKSVINKTGDTTNSGDSVDFYGTNSAILIKKGSSANIDNVEINTNATGSNAIFVTNAESGDDSSNQGGKAPMGGQPDGMPGQDGGEKPADMPTNNGGEKPDEPSGNDNMQEPAENGQNAPDGQSNTDYSTGGANASVTNVIINTYKDKSRGIDATYGGKISVADSVINTRGGSCAALATDRGEGTINADKCELNTGVDNGSGRGSPCIYSTGNITVSDSKGTAYNSQIACIEGKNSITMDNCELSCFAGGNREDNGKFVDLGGIFIYQSMSGDADVGTATLNAKDSRLSIDESSEHYTTAPMFHVTNTKAIINIENTEVKFGSNTLLNISGQNQWGNVGSNGGELVFNCNEEKIKGNIYVDGISSLKFDMKNTEYTGAVNPTEDNGETNVTLDTSSTWTLTEDSHITNLENNGKIDYANHTLYVNGQAYTSSNPYK